MPISIPPIGVYLPLLETSAFALPHRPDFEPARVGNQLTKPALGYPEIPRKPHGRAGLGANGADLNIEARCKLATLDKGGVHPLTPLPVDVTGGVSVGRCGAR
jgi:hypothetical protein